MLISGNSADTVSDEEGSIPSKRIFTPIVMQSTAIDIEAKIVLIMSILMIISKNIFVLSYIFFHLFVT